MRCRCRLDDAHGICDAHEDDAILMSVASEANRPSMTRLTFEKISWHAASVSSQWHAMSARPAWPRFSVNVVVTWCQEPRW